MGVSDAPKFQVGDKESLFVQNKGSQFIRLVGIMHGRFRVRTNESGHEIVTNSEDEPVKNVAHLGKISSAPSPEEPDLSAGDFKAAVKNRLQRQQ
jgi:hypothetical protein